MTVIDRTLLLASCAFFAAIGTLLLAAPHFFYDTIPGVAASGPMNVHLLRDVGIAYVLFAIGFAFATRNVTLAKFVSPSAALYLVGHAALHLTIDHSSGSTALFRTEALGVYVPPALAIAVAFRVHRRSFAG